MNNKLKYGVLVGVAAVIAAGVASILAISPAFAQGNAPGVSAAISANVSTSWAGRGGFGGGIRGRGPGGMIGGGILGTVDTISGTTLTVTSKMPIRPNPNASGTPTANGGESGIVYTVDASNAQIVKNGASSTLASVVEGDTVVIQGAVNGTNITAKVIHDGVVPGMMPGMPGKGFGGAPFGNRASSTPPLQGNGEPVIAGAVTIISGNTVTITNASNVTYTIDASSAKIIVNGTSSVVSNIMVGDNLVVQGTVNGNSVTASSILDQGSGHGHVGSSSPSGAAVHVGGGFNIFGSIGGFFKKLFGF